MSFCACYFAQARLHRFDLKQTLPLATMVNPRTFACLWFLSLVWSEASDCESCETPSKSSSLLQARVHKDPSVAKELANLATVVSEMQEELHELKANSKAKDVKDTGMETTGTNNFGPRSSALLKRLHQNSEVRSPMCKRVPSVHSERQSNESHESVTLTSSANNRNNATAFATCSSDSIKLMDFEWNGVASSCCPLSKMECSGCASFSGGTCQKCEGGFVKRGDFCIACASSSDWVSAAGLSCTQISPSDCNDVPVRGQSSNHACCQCGGGHVTPTPFEYPNLRWSLSTPIVLKPEPRTAQRYTVDSACELAAHNLTLDGSTGVISYMDGKEKPKEAFSFPCEVTAHQAPHVTLIAVVTVAADFLNYKSDTLLFHGSSTESPWTGSWSDFAMTCAPKVPWLSVNTHTGVLQASTAVGSGGVSVAEDHFYGQDGAVCEVTAWVHHPGTKQHQTSFVALKPRPWPSLKYDLATVSVSLGQELPPLKPQVTQVHLQPGIMKPFTFNMACRVTGSSGSTFIFDRLLHMGFVDGHSVVELDLDGQITVAPATTLTDLFDRSTQNLGRKTLTLACRIFGIFPDPQLPPVETTLNIKIQDSICWVQQAIRGIAILDTATSLVQCRSRCRASSVCANYRFASGSCMRYDVRKDGQEVTVHAKVTNCTMGSCMQVQHDKWYLAGRYCPLGYDALKGGLMYRRQHVTPEDAVYLYRYQHRAGDACSAGQWILQKTAENDYADVSRGIFEFKGTTLACLAESHVDFALDSCSTSPLASEEEK